MKITTNTAEIYDLIIERYGDLNGSEWPSKTMHEWQCEKLRMINLYYMSIFTFHDVHAGHTLFRRLFLRF